MAQQASGMKLFYLLPMFPFISLHRFRFISCVYSRARCWLNFTRGQAWRWTVYYLPLIFLMILVLVLYALILYVVIAKMKERPDKEDAKLLILKLIAYPIIFWFCYIFAIVNRFADVASKDEVCLHYAPYLYFYFSLRSSLLSSVSRVSHLCYFSCKPSSPLWLAS